MRIYIALMRSASLIAGTLLVAAASHTAVAQTAAAPDQRITHTVHSSVLGEDRTIEVFLPAGYQVSETYDVIYVLDAEMLVRFVPPIRAFGEINDLIPPVIIVGVDNLYRQETGASTRDRDLLPSGGADKFLTFVTSELRAFVDSTYSTSRQTTLFGHSYGGLFTVYALLTHPESFDHYIASDPALWWNAGYLSKIAAEQLRRFPSDRRTLFIGSRAGRINEAFGIRQFTALLKARAPASLRWKSVANDDEDHGSVRLKNIYDGLKFSYFGHSGALIDVFPTDGILLAGKPIGILSYTTSLGENPGIRYTTDGSAPTASSPRYEYGIQVSAPAQLTVKQFSNWGPDKTRTGRFVVGRTIAAESLPADAKRGRIHVERPEGSGAGFTQGFEIGTLGGKEPFALSFTGWFEAEASGYFVFFLDSDGMASLRVSGTKFLTVSGDSGSRSFAAPLAKGVHRIEVIYRHEAGEPHLDLTYLSPAADRDLLARLPIPIPAELLFAH